MQKHIKAAKDSLAHAWNENPYAVVAVAVTATVTIAKIVDSTTAARNSRTWQKEVDRRTRTAR